MNQISNPENPAFTRGYIPYFYEAGLYQWNPLQPDHPSIQSPAASHPTYDFTSDLIQRQPRPSYPTVEQIVSRGYFAVPNSDPTTALISDRKTTARLGLDDVIHQVRHRYEIYEANWYGIELAKCSAISAMLSMESERGAVPADSRELYSVNKTLDRLYQQQREERVLLWQDVSRLRLALPENAQNYLTAHRKVALLEDERGDAP